MKNYYNIKPKTFAISMYLTANSIFALSVYASQNEFLNLDNELGVYLPTASVSSNTNKTSFKPDESITVENNIIYLPPHNQKNTINNNPPISLPLEETNLSHEVPIVQPRIGIPRNVIQQYNQLTNKPDIISVKPIPKNPNVYMPSLHKKNVQKTKPVFAESEIIRPHDTISLNQQRKPISENIATRNHPIVSSLRPGPIQQNLDIYDPHPHPHPQSIEIVGSVPSTVHTLKRKPLETPFTSEPLAKRQRTLNPAQEEFRYYGNDVRFFNTFTQPDNRFNSQTAHQNSFMQPTPPASYRPPFIPTMPQTVSRNEVNLMAEENRKTAKDKFDLAIQYLNDRQPKLCLELMRECAATGYEDAIKFMNVHKQENAKNGVYEENVTQNFPSPANFVSLPKKVLPNSQVAYPLNQELSMDPSLLQKISAIQNSTHNLAAAFHPSNNSSNNDLSLMDIVFLQKQAEQNNDDARFELVMRYSKGKGVEKNLDLMNRYLFKINTNQHMAASLFMGKGNLKGINGFEKDSDEAKRYLKIAAELGSFEAQNLLKNLDSHEEKTNNILEENTTLNIIEEIPYATVVSVKRPSPVIAQNLQPEKSKAQIPVVSSINKVAPSVDLKIQTIVSLKKLLTTYS
ncbi:MAG: tetratricopeptide repeat protein [Janthinobacterium lividum]